MSRLFFRAWFFSVNLAASSMRCFLAFLLLLSVFCSWRHQLDFECIPIFFTKKKVGHFKKTPVPQFRIPGISAAASRNNPVLYHAHWTPVHIRRGISKLLGENMTPLKWNSWNLTKSPSLEKGLHLSNLHFAVIAYAALWFHVTLFFWVGFRFHPSFVVFWGIFGRTNMTCMIDQKLGRVSDGTLW